MMELYQICSQRLRRTMLVQLGLSWAVPSVVLGMGLFTGFPWLGLVIAGVFVGISCQRLLPFTVNKQHAIFWYVVQFFGLSLAMMLWVLPLSLRDLYVPNVSFRYTIILACVGWSLFWAVSTLMDMWKETAPENLPSFSWVFWNLEDARMYHCFGVATARTPVVQFMNAVEPELQEQGVIYPPWWLRLFAQHIVSQYLPSTAAEGKLSAFYEFYPESALTSLLKWGAPDVVDERWVYAQQLTRTPEEFITYYYESPREEGVELAPMSDFS